MRILEVLTRLERVEKEMAEFYEWLSEVFDDDPEASGLFFRMSLQEKSHASLIQYGRKLVHRSPNEFDDVDFDHESVDAMLDSIAAFRADHPSPDLGTALFFAMRIECHPAENSHRDVLAVSNPGLGQMIQSLAIADEEHHRTLSSFAQARSDAFD